MHAPEIQDWQFGRLRWRDDWGWYSERVEWTSGLMIELCIRTKLTESRTIPELARTIFCNLRDRQNELTSYASRDLLDTWNKVWNDYDEESRPSGWPLGSQDFINFITLCAVIINTNGECELNYTTHGGPLIRVMIAPDLSFKEAFLD